MAKKTVLLLGATGFVGKQVLHLLLKNGYQVTCAVRNTELLKKQYPEIDAIKCDFLQDTKDTDWTSRLKNIDIIINCVGIFYDRDPNLIWKTHFATPKAIFNAAIESNVQKIIHLSALGIENYQTSYAASKQALEDFLQQLPITSIILKPSFIYGNGARGGLLLIKSLSALPGMISLPGAGNQLFQPIFVEDLATAILNLIDNDNSLKLAAVSENQITLKTMMVEYRNWLGFGKAIFFKVPLFLIKTMGWFGNFFSGSIVNREAIQMLTQGNTTTVEETKKFQDESKVKPLPFSVGLQSMTATTAEKWYARLFLLKPILRLSLAFLWIFSGVTSIFLFSHHISFERLLQVGIPQNLLVYFLYGGAILDLLIGSALLLNFKTKLNCILQLIVMSIYTFIISWKLPHFWLEPFGPIIKNIPILVSILLLFSMEEQ